MAVWVGGNYRLALVYYMSQRFSLFGLFLLRALGRLPLPCLRALGAGLGALLFVLVRPRRHVVLVNLRLCFPEYAESARLRLARRVFIAFVQTWLDRGWLWSAPVAKVRARLEWSDAAASLAGDAPTILLVPHFMGLDAGGAAVLLHCSRPMVSIFTPQQKPVLDAWMLNGRRRFGALQLFQRTDGVKPLVKGLRAGQLFYLLPDMDFGERDTVFAPFFGVAASTTPSLHRFAKLGGAKVAPLVARITPTGYRVEVLPAWPDFPSANLQADTERMNREIEQLVRTMPEQYYWVHKRFKTRPAGQASFYA
jgi:Kdo2-lipid IVA lauroyltransferase/acyltransferase